MDTLKGRPTGRPVRLTVGVANALPKLIAYRLLEPALRLPEPVRIVCREDRSDRLLAELAVHALDLVLSPPRGKDGGHVTQGRRLLFHRHRRLVPPRPARPGAPLVSPRDAARLRRPPLCAVVRGRPRRAARAARPQRPLRLRQRAQAARRAPRRRHRPQHVAARARRRAQQPPPAARRPARRPAPRRTPRRLAQPRTAGAWNTGDSVMATYVRHSDAVLAAASPRQLAGALGELARL